MNAPRHQSAASYGHFDDDAREYVITTPLTPRAWENRLWNDDLVVQINNHGGGITYQRDHAGAFVLLNWSGHRALYLYDCERDDLWSPAWYPVNAELDHYRCRHGLHYTIISGRRDGIHAEWATSVHAQASAELWRVTLTNRDTTPRHLRLVPYYQLDLACKDPYFGNANRFVAETGANHLQVRNDSHHGAAAAYAATWQSSWSIDDFELDREAFFAGFASSAAPASVRDGAFTGSHPDRGGPVFAPLYELTLAPGESRVLQVAISAGSEPADIDLRADPFAAAVAHHRRRGDQLQARANLRTGQPDIDRMLNLWIPHQLAYNASWNRGWGIGFRDGMQDGDAWRLHDPAAVRHRLRQAAAHIYADGHTVRKWAPLDDKLYFDGGVWFVNTLVDLVRETGETELLAEAHPFLDDGAASLREHAERALGFLHRQRGPNGLCRMGFGDWNDALNGIDREGRGESIWTSMAFVWASRQWGDLLSELDDAAATEHRRRAEAMAERLRASCCEGDRYIRAITDDGTRVGSGRGTQDRLFLNPQSWAIIAGVAPRDRHADLLRSVNERLMTPWGPVLLDPPFTAYDARIGRLSADPPGRVENGANYVHASMFYAYALALAERPDAAWEVLRRILPGNPDNPPAQSLLEPWSLTNAFEGPASAHPGRAFFSWRTGSAGWFIKVLWDGLLGIVPELGGVRLTPRLPAAWAQPLEATRTLRGAAVTFIFSAVPVTADITCAAGDRLAWSQLLDGVRVHVHLPAPKGS